MTTLDRRRHPAVFLSTAGTLALVTGLTHQLVPAVHGVWPMNLAAGLALAVCMTFGRSAGLGVLAGSLLAQAFGPMRAGADVPWSLVATWLAQAMLVAVQAWLGARLVRRRVARQPQLGTVTEIAAFVGWGGLLPHALGASIATAALSFSQPLAHLDQLAVWLTWCLGGTLGVAIGAPVTHALMARPGLHWRHRRQSVAVPLLAVTATMGLAAAAVSQWDQERRNSQFQRDAVVSAEMVATGLQGPLLALQATRGLFMGQASVSAAQMKAATDSWLRQPYALHVIGYSKLVPQDKVPAYEAQVRAEGMPQFRVFNRTGPGAAPVEGDKETMVLRYIESLAPVQPDRPPPFGLNAFSVAAARTAIGQARERGAVVATAGFRLTAGDDRQMSVVVYQPLFEGPGGAFSGVVYVAASMQALLDSLLSKGPARLDGCLVDVTQPDRPARLAGDLGCERQSADARRQVREIAYAGRLWALRLSARPQSSGWLTTSWLFGNLCMAVAATLGAMLLVMSSHTNRVERAVRERTAALRREVRERQRTEAAWRESEARLRAIFASAPVGIVYADLDDRVLHANPAYCLLLGRTEAQLRGGSQTELLPEADRPAVAQHLARLVAGEADTVHMVHRYLKHDGSTADVQVSVALLRDEAEHVYGTVRVVQDIHERLRLAEAELARDSAQAANRAKSEFVSRMSHELRTPLNAMLGFAQLLGLDRHPPMAEHQLAWARQIQQAGWHLLRMINDTLDLSRIETGDMPLHLEPVEVRPMVESAVAMVQANAVRHGVQMQAWLDDRALLALADDTRVRQILLNLLSNAIKYNREGGRVEVLARVAEAQTIEIEVADTGPGLSAAQLAQLFQPYNRLGRERGAVEGTGIGLVISKRLAELMGGSLQARSTEGQGSQFVLRLPQAQTPRRPPQRLPDAVDEAARTMPALRRVHYVEDNDTNIEVMRGILQQRGQVDLEVTMTGTACLAALAQRRPDLLLLDMHLPDMDGLQLLAQLRRNPALAQLPVLVLSADPDADRVSQALASGARCYLTKPVNITEFLALLDEQLKALA